MRCVRPLPTLERVADLLDYDAGTGVFTWRRTVSGYIVANRRAGTFDTLGYRSICIDGKIVKEHRLAWFIIYGKWPALGLDHINGNPGDNRIANLREATASQNNANSRLRRGSTSGVKGVTRYKSSWVARIRVAGKSQYLGSFETKEVAHAAYVAAAAKHYGQFARAE